MKTLIILTPAFPDSEQNQNWLPFLQSLVRAINANFPEIEIIILPFQYLGVTAPYNWHGNRVIPLALRKDSRIQKRLVYLRAWRTLKQLKKDKQVIGLFSLWHTECAFIGSRFGRKYNLRHLNWLCGQEVKTGNKFVAKIKARGNELIAMSDFLKREFLENYGVQPEYVIPVGVNPIAPSDFTRDVDILGVGNLKPLKQYDIFVNTVAELVKTGLKLKVVLCGSGPDETVLKKQASASGVANNITFTGEIPNGNVLELMQRASIFLHTSSYEGFGTVCLEALSAGAHVVSFTKPMDQEIDHWHHVTTHAEMTAKVQELLNEEHLDHSPVTPFPTTFVAQEITRLFL